MANNVFMSEILLGSAEWSRLTPSPTVVNVTISITPTGTVSQALMACVRYDGQQFCEWPVNSVYSFEGVDVSKFEFQCDASLRVLAIGNTR